MWSDSLLRFALGLLESLDRSQAVEGVDVRLDRRRDEHRRAPVLGRKGVVHDRREIEVGDRRPGTAAEPRRGGVGREHLGKVVEVPRQGVAQVEGLALCLVRVG